MRIFIYSLMAFMLYGCGGGETGQVPISTTTGNLILQAEHGVDGAAYGLSDCGACHALAVIHKQAPQIRGMVAAKGFNSCTGCHGDNGTEEPRACLICHNATDLPQSPQLSGQYAHLFQEHNSLSDADCVTCHQASDMDGVFEPQVDLTHYAGGNAYNNSSEFCLRCHNRDNHQAGFEFNQQDYDSPLIAMADNYHFIDKHGWVDGVGQRTYSGLRPGYTYQTLVACTDCHAMHGTTNQHLIIDQASKGASRLSPDFSTYPVSIHEGNYAQLCVLCHQMETSIVQGDMDAGNGLSGVHLVNGDCRPCHTHGEAVQAGL
ncbi:cytochrome c3 family protein [Candidatus Venteria ishoeyi]|uniref:Doubled CXXCH motif (Paired_CXXCH_1) n=1 Tax=Candidatus Venteria ishoeyi TaxID=1899563 RepID=A0A1H6FF14_9GAMM|nr:cytochrome c3 family protein [Candidatus Venteria ishoeyi]SEH07939.1 Doubled CXXCH motif (Paired_CXXCH_1) [Candidatus Venteria ishoeyi]